MKIMFYTSSLGKGGAERVISVLANELIKNHEITIVVNTLKNIAYKTDEKIKLIELDRKHIKSNIIRNINRISVTEQIIKQEKPDIIISFLPIPSYRILSLKSKIKDIPIIISDRNDPKQEYKSFIDKFLMKKLYKRADGFVFQTVQQKEYFSEFIRKKSTVIFNPIKDEFLEIEERKKENNIINVGRLVEQKNQEMLINVFSKISDKYKEYSLKIFGDGPLKERLQRQINDLGLEDRVELCGISNNIKMELEKAKLFILCSDYEGMPNALIEAMAVGLPVISTDCPCGGPRELIEENKNGILVDIKDEDMLQEALEKVLSDNEFSKYIGENAKKIKYKLQLSKILQDWEEYINKIYKEKGVKK